MSVKQYEKVLNEIGNCIVSQDVDSIDQNLRLIYLEVLRNVSLLDDGDKEINRELLLLTGLKVADSNVLNELNASPLNVFKCVSKILQSLQNQELCVNSLPFHTLDRIIKVVPVNYLCNSGLVACVARVEKSENDPLEAEALEILVRTLAERKEELTIELAKEMWPLLVQKLKWKSGRKRATLRVHVSSLLYYCASQFFIQNPAGLSRPRFLEFLALGPGSLPEVFMSCASCMDDESFSTRMSLVQLTSVLFEWESISLELIKVVYPELLKRFDDSLDDIRIHSLHAVGKLYQFQDCMKSSGESLDQMLDGVHHCEIVKAITIHVDDTNDEVQNAAISCLQCVFKEQPLFVTDHISSVYHLFRNSHQLKQFVSSQMCASTDKKIPAFG
jgi:hypothetical protein